MRFEDYFIEPEIKNNLQRLGYKRPTDIQFKAIPHILKGEDLLAIAQTGTGKTAAFAIPLINVLHERKNSKRRQGIKALILEPTRELAVQISEVFHQIAKKTRVKAATLHGGVDQDPQIKKLEEGLDVLISTPGRLFDLIHQGYVDISSLEILVLDEADHMLELGFLKDINDLLKILPKRRQTLFFSATINEKIKKLAYSMVSKPIRIQISPKDPVSRNVTHSVVFVEMEDKRFFLERIVRENPSSKILVFVRTKVRAERVKNAMQRVDISALTLHSDKEQKERFQTLNEFKQGKCSLLIATDVSARGIDIPNVDYVINYDLPDQSENYVHRVGRTGRGVKKGLAISFCSEEEKPMLQEIELYLEKPIEKVSPDKDFYQITIDFSKSSQPTLQDLIKEIHTEDMKTSQKRKKKNKK
jgi:ATP-dependent RNA helicase RhlE